MSLNSILLIHIVVSVGISVDYSTHIAYAYLVEYPSEGDKCETSSQIRLWKAKMALRKMGSSVFHGGLSTFLAICVLAPVKNYIFLTFFRLWFGIILFGLANGFVLLPVLLSLVGPTTKVVEHLYSDSEDGATTCASPEKNQKV